MGGRKLGLTLIALRRFALVAGRVTTIVKGGFHLLHPHLRGEGGHGKADKGTDKLREWDSERGVEGVKKTPQNCGCHKWKPPKALHKCDR